MSFQSTQDDDAFSREAPRRGRSTLWIVLALVVVVAAAGGALYWLSKRFGPDSAASANVGAAARSYRTLARTELRTQANSAARVIVTLREGTTVSGVSAGNQDGIDWLEITAVDGTKGFAPKSLMQELGPAASASQLVAGTRRLVTSTTVNLRETPSLSGKIVGVAEGGTRLVSDGSIQSEGEDWLRVPLDGQTTVYIMQRFTTSDDDAGGGEGLEGDPNAAIGVRGFATQIANVQATPLDNARIVRALQLQEEVRVIGQTNAGRAWYVLRLSDGSQGFAPREAIRIDPTASRWVYPDGTLAPGPNIPKGYTTPVTVSGAKSGAKRQGSGENNATSGNGSTTSQTPTDSTQTTTTETQSTNPAPTPAPTPAPVEPVPGPQ